MGILDFTEIPRPVKNNSLGVESEDLDAFEKFAEEFFERILGAKIIERIRRGPDNGLDLKIERNGEHQLVSCKHYAHSDRSIGTTIEEKPVEATISNHCDSFIGFYSTIPHESLIKTLEGCKNNPKYTFNYEIFKSSDIESKLLDSNNAKGWLLAARYFPRSFVNLFRRFVVPIQHYKVSDVKKTGNSWLLEGPFGARVTGGTPEELVETANENLTSALHCNFFKEAIMDAIKLFPRYFVCTKDADFKKLKLEDISPAWCAF